MKKKSTLSPKENNGPVVKTGPTAGQNRARNSNGRWRAKRSDAGVTKRSRQESSESDDSVEGIIFPLMIIFAAITFILISYYIGWVNIFKTVFYSLLIIPCVYLIKKLFFRGRCVDFNTCSSFTLFVSILVLIMMAEYFPMAIYLSVFFISADQLKIVDCTNFSEVKTGWWMTYISAIIFIVLVVLLKPWAQDVPDLMIRMISAIPVIGFVLTIIYDDYKRHGDSFSGWFSIKDDKEHYSYSQSDD